MPAKCHYLTLNALSQRVVLSLAQDCPYYHLEHNGNLQNIKFMGNAVIGNLSQFHEWWELFSTELFLQGILPFGKGVWCHFQIHFLCALCLFISIIHTVTGQESETLGWAFQLNALPIQGEQEFEILHEVIQDQGFSWELQVALKLKWSQTGCLQSCILSANISSTNLIPKRSLAESYIVWHARYFCILLALENYNVSGKFPWVFWKSPEQMPSCSRWPCMLQRGLSECFTPHPKEWIVTCSFVSCPLENLLFHELKGNAKRKRTPKAQSSSAWPLMAMSSYKPVLHSLAPAFSHLHASMMVCFCQSGGAKEKHV